MPRKRKSAPQRVDETKRQCLSWNMQDMNAGLQVVHDQDPLLHQETQEAEQLLVQGKQTRPSFNSHSQWPRYLQDDNILKDLLEDCEFYVSIYDELKLRPQDWHCELAKFTVQLLSPSGGKINNCRIELPKCEEFWIYFSVESGKHMIYYEWEENDENTVGTSNRMSILYFRATIKPEIPFECLEGLQQRAFHLTLSKYSAEKGELELSIHMTESAATKLQFASEAGRPKKANLTIQHLMSIFHGFHFTDYQGKHWSRKEDVAGLYSDIKVKHEEQPPSVKLNVQHTKLIPRLRQYQKLGVLWMLEKERYGEEEDQDEKGDSTIHPLYEPFQTLDGQFLFYNKNGGYIVREKPLLRSSPPGGILGDEMGLGKTVEVLACMLSHPRADLPPQEPLPLDQTKLKVPEVITPSESSNDNSNFSNISTKTEKTDSTLDSPIQQATDPLVNTGTADEKPTQGPRDSSLSTGTSDKCGDTEKKYYEDQCANEAGGEDETSWADPVVKIVIDDNSFAQEEKTGLDDSSCTEKGKIGLTIDTSPVSIDHDYCLSPRSLALATASAELSAKDGPSERKAVPECIDTDVCGLKEADATISKKCGDSSDVMVTVKQSTVELNSNKIPEPDSVDIHHVHRDAVMEAGQLETRHKGNKNAENMGTETENPGTDGQGVNKMTPCPETHNVDTLDTTKSNKTSETDANKEGVSTDETAIKNIHVETYLSNVDSETYVMDCNVKADEVDKTPECNLEEPSTSAGATTYSTSRKCRKSMGGSLRNRRKFVETVAIEDAPEATYFEPTVVQQKEYFECVCGTRLRHKDTKLRVQCESCMLWQHPECVNYDVDDPYRGPYKCPHCHVASKPIPSGATLIISPNSISHQWVEEIRKHIRQQSIKVLVYTGVHKQGFIQPQTLANHDIVITTYETLRKEIDYVDLPHSNSEAGRRFRHPKRFMAIPSPIVAVEWWRICLDEAQMVECITTKTAEMALRLTAVNRWCVTGTPIQRGIDDLYGLLLFLGVDPYWVQFWWNKLLYQPYCYGNHQPMVDAITKVLWRTSKNDVLDQIDLPMQAEEVHWLNFSPVEEHFYRRQYKHCATQAMKQLSKWTDSAMRLSDLDRYTLHQLLHPLVRLRQACCHPQAVRGEFLPLHKSTMTMEELLASLTKKAKTECEEAHRQYVAAMNGMAGYHIIREQYAEAVECYREVLRSVEEHKTKLGTDDLQQLHAIHNLHEVLQLKPEGVGPTLRDGQLQQQARELRDKYLAKAASFVASAQEAWAPTRASLTDLTKQFRSGQAWWSDLIQYTLYSNIDDLLIERVKDDLSDNARPDTQSIVYRFSDARGLQYVVQAQLQQLENAHQTLVSKLHSLGGHPSQHVINTTVECCLRPAAEILKNCPFCQADELFQEYESKLFSFTDKGLQEHTGVDDETSYAVGTKRQGTWADSELEKTLKIFINFAKTSTVNREWVEYGNLHIKMFEVLKKEFKVWMALREQVSALDELDMATTRLRLRLPDEPETETPQMNIIDKSALEQQRLKLVTDRVVGQNELRKKLGQLLYLKNLATAQTDMQGGFNPEPCPICQHELGKKWCVLQCGHCFCMDCIRILIEQYSFGGTHRSLKCAICRQRTPHADISYVSTKAKAEAESDAMKETRVKGDHSTKIEGIVKCLLEIQQSDPGAKALVFSTWQDVLDIIARALTENNIMFKSLHAQHKFQSNLWNFRHDDKIQVLLLPVHSGANGLNLIEATHVLLVEPILNQAQELQAVGRVHRIGQTRPTTVHRFLVKSTIEERMHSLLQTVQAPVNAHNSEETMLTIGDLVELFTDMAPPVEEDEEQPADGLEASILGASTVEDSQGQVATLSITADRVSEGQLASTSGMTADRLSQGQEASTSGITTDRHSEGPEASTSGITVDRLIDGQKLSTSDTGVDRHSQGQETLAADQLSQRAEASTSGMTTDRQGKGLDASLALVTEGCSQEHVSYTPDSCADKPMEDV